MNRSIDSAQTDITRVWEELAKGEGGRIIYLVLDGGGGLADPHSGQTALQAANTPNLDALAGRSACGALELVGPGITPGSGAGHLALFGYDPLRYRLGRGVLSALGIDFPLQEGDVAARVNFATLDTGGKVADRRAGRIDSETNQRLCEKIKQDIELDFDGEYFLETVAEHRGVLVLRGANLNADIRDTDPQTTGVAPHPPNARCADAETTSNLIQAFVRQVQDALREEPQADAVLLRGFERYRPLPTLDERFALNGLCVARYPMYRGLSRLLGMDVAEAAQDIHGSFARLGASFDEAHDFYFLHVKETDSHGEDGNFHHKVKVIEQVDTLLPRLFDLQPEVLVVSSDHSTPAVMSAHSWHPVPVLIHAAHARVDEVERFDEYACRHGALGLRPGVHLMGLALAHAGRLRKFGA